MVFLKHFIARVWPDEPSWRRSYRVAIYLCVAALIHSAVLKSLLIPNQYPWAIGAFSAIGFCMWIWPMVHEVWMHKLSLPVRGLVHAGIILCSYLLARIVVSQSLQLPAKDFEGTVAVIAIYLCPCIYLMLIACTCSVVAIASMALAGTLVILNSIMLRPFTCLIGGKFLKIGFFNDEMSKQSHTVNTLLAHVLGAMFTAYAVATCHDVAQSFLLKNDQLTKRVAYYLDYHRADRYPGVRPGQRFNLHDNGVVSYARISDGRIEIDVDKVKL